MQAALRIIIGVGKSDKPQLESLSSKQLRALLKSLGLPLKRSKADGVQEVRKYEMNHKSSKSR